MAIKPKPRAEVEAAWREWLTDQRRALPPTRNRDNVLYLTDPMRMAYRGRIYEILPVPFRSGLRAIAIQEKAIEAAKVQDYTTYAAALNDALELIRKGVRPYRASWIVRLAWALGWNPFKDATEMEVGEFLMGFIIRRTTPRG